jgi:uncharacterized protein (TIRG00374 family)
MIKKYHKKKLQKKLWDKIGAFKQSNKSILLMITSILGLIGITIILLTTNFTEIIEFFTNTTTTLVIIFILIQIALMTTLTLRWATIIKSQGHKKINLFRLNKYRIAGQAISFLTPTAKMGGEGVKTRLMSKRESLPYGKSLSTIVLDNSIDMTTSGFFFLIGAIIVLISINTGLATKIFLSTLVVLFIAVLAILNYRLFKGKTMIYGLANKIGIFKIKKIKKLKKEFKKFDEYLHDFYKKDKKYFFYTVALSFTSWILMFLEYYIAGRMLGINFSIWMIFLIVTLVGIAYLLPIPMALGTLEAGQISAFAILSLSSAAAVGLSFIIRAKDMLIAFWGIGILSFYGFDINKSLAKTGIGDEINEISKNTKTKKIKIK